MWAGNINRAHVSSLGTTSVYGVTAIGILCIHLPNSA